MYTKICTNCNKDLSVEMFNKNKTRKDGISNWCKDCVNLYNQQYRKENKEKSSLYNKQYRISNKEKLLSMRKLEYEKNKEYYKSYMIEWQKNNKENCKKSKHTRKSKKNQVISTLTIEQWDIIKKAFDNKCAYCGKELPLEQEHFIPLSKGGEYTINNIIPACKSCNCSKGNKDFFEWYPKHRHYSKKREKFILEFLNYDKNKRSSIPQISNSKIECAI